MNRRHFIRTAAATAAAACCGMNTTARPAAAARRAAGRRRIGIQLYSIRETLPGDPAGCIRKLADIGYLYAEAYGFDGSVFLKKNLSEWSLILNDAGMKLSGTHCGTGMLPVDVNTPEWNYWRKSIDEMNAAGGQRLIQSFLPGMKLKEGLLRVAEQFNRIGALCRDGGLRFGYHNHHSELRRVDGEVTLDLLLQNTDPDLVFFQLDLGHAVNGGADVLDYMRKYPGRFLSWHASDFKTGQGYTEVGQGDVPYDALFDLADAYGLEDLTVEQETEGDIYGACRRDFDFLAKYPWTEPKQS
ncbi:MAG: sugar phosphate isomerase/epimerase [Tannerella sp.]|jgi:sugar phosphate isomerase/epimerase|nr:sugar phosphate isomerase/epimerase [Tannerella sp.]